MTESTRSEEARSSDESILAYLAAWDDALERGCAPPELPETLRRALDDPGVARLRRAMHVRNRLAGSTAPTSPAGPPTASEPATPSVPGFEILGELGRGGRGVVYKARDLGLGRVVALKMILSGPFASAAEQRLFRQEVTAIAQMDHPNVVPIYESRQDYHLPYFTMRWVDGGSLADRRGAFVDRPRDAARLVAAVARGVHHAHERGFLHRDLKPANVLLEGDGRPLVADFGFSKRLDAAEGSLSAVVGTARYMAPEQAEGRRGEAATLADVYGLGAILYELLTGAAPFRAADLPGRLREERECGLERPSRRNPGVDRDLEAICLKCLDAAPARRYASAQQLAEELERWAAGEPILARPPTLREELRRWVRHHPRLVLTAGFVGLLCVTVAVAATVAAVRIERARSRERAALASAEARADLAIEAVRKFREAVASNLDVRNRPDLDGLRKRLLDEPLRFFRQLRQELQSSRDPTPATALKLGRANLELAQLLAVIDTRPNAIRAFLEAVATLEPLELGVEGAGPDVRAAGEARLLLADALGRLALLHRDGGDLGEARAALGRALAVAERAVRRDPSPRALAVQARALDRAALIEAPDDPGASLALLERAASILKPLTAASAGLAEDPDLPPFVAMHLGTRLKALGRRSEAAGRFEEAIAALEALVRGSPGNPSYRANLASAHFNLANLRLLDREFRDHRGEFERARDLWEALVRDAPTAGNYRNTLSAVHGTLGVIYEGDGEFDRARAALERARELGEGLVREHPDIVGYRTTLGVTCINLAELEIRTGRPARAAEVVGPMIDGLRQVYRSRPGDLAARDALGAACANYGAALADLGRPAEGLAAYREGEGLQLESLRDGRPPNRGQLGHAVLGISRCLLDLGRVDEAARSAETLRDSWDGNPGELASIARQLALCSAASTDPAARYADRAMELLREAVAAGYRDVNVLRTDPAFEPLRRRPGFRDLEADAAFPDDPFAAP